MHTSLQQSAGRLRQWLTHPTLIAVLTLTLLWMLFFWRLITPNLADRLIFNQRGDFILHFYAPTSIAVERFWHGQIALWNPYNNAGEPLLGNIQAGVLYPPRYAAALLAGPDGWKFEAYQLEIAAHYWLASLWMFLFLMAVTRRQGVALVGAILYAYNGYATGYAMLQGATIETETWLPLALLGITLSVTRAGWGIRGSLLAAVSLCLSLLAGRPQSALYVLAIVAAYQVYLGHVHKTGWRGIFWRLALACGLGLLLAGAQLLPAWEFGQHSTRAATLNFDGKDGGYSGTELVRLIWPGLFGSWSPLYVGVAGLMLALSGLISRRRDWAFWGGALAISLFLSLGSNGILYDLFYNIAPGFGLFRNQERVSCIVMFSLIMLAVHQLDALWDGKKPDHHSGRLASGYAAFLTAAYLIGMLALMLGFGDVQDEVISIFGVTALVGLVFALWQAWQPLYRGPRWHISLPLMALLVADLFNVGMHSINFVPDTPDNRLTPSVVMGWHRASMEQMRWRIDGGVGLQGANVYYRIPDIFGVGPLSLESMDQLKTIPVDRYWEVLSVRYVTTSVEPPADAPLMILATDVNESGQEYRLFEITSPRPLAHLVYDTRVADGNPYFARQIMADSQVNLREMAVTLAPLPFDLPGRRPSISRVDDFQIVTPELWSMSVSTGANALLTLSVPNYPGWKAEVDGQPVVILDTNGGLIGIPIPKGDHQVVLRFAPDSLMIGVGISAAAGLIILSLLVIDVWQRRKSV